MSEKNKQQLINSFVESVTNAATSDGGLTIREFVEAISSVTAGTITLDEESMSFGHDACNIFVGTVLNAINERFTLINFIGTKH